MGEDSERKCPYGPDLCPKLLQYMEQHEKEYRDLRKDMEFVKKLTIALAALILGTDVIALVI